MSVCSFVTPDGRRCVLEAPHATSHQVEESPAPPPVGMDDVQSYTDSWRSASSDERLVRSRTVTDRVRELTGYAHRSQPQEAELTQLAAEAVALDELVARCRAPADSARRCAHARRQRLDAVVELARGITAVPHYPG